LLKTECDFAEEKVKAEFDSAVQGKAEILLCSGKDETEIDSAVKAKVG
jgi:hypothetical protein